LFPFIVDPAAPSEDVVVPPPPDPPSEVEAPQECTPLEITTVAV
jgi:hypothetical protein